MSTMPISFRELFHALPADLHIERHGERYKWMVLIVVALGTIAGVLATTSFNVAVPALMRDFAIGQEQVQWAITGFMAAMTVGMLPTPWLLQRIGFRRLFLGGIAVLAAGGIAGACASNFTLVVVLRIVQGLAAGVLQPLGTIAVMRLFPSHEQGRASGILGFGIVLAPALAPTLGGLMLDGFGWPAIFLINLPPCLIAATLGFFLLPVPKPQAEEERRDFDWIGVGLLTLMSVAVVECIASLQHSGPTAPWTLGFAGVVALALAAFVGHARRTRHPIIDLGLFGKRTFTLGTFVTFTYGFGLYASAYLIPVYLQQALRYSATDAGVALLPSGIVLALTIPLAGRGADRYSPLRVTRSGLAVFALSFVFLGLVAGHVTYPEIIGATVLGRIGLGLILPALSLATLRGMAPHQLGQSSVVVSYARQLGGVLGIAVAAVYVSWRESAPDGISAAYAEAFLMTAGVFVLALAAASFMKSGQKD